MKTSKDYCPNCHQKTNHKTLFVKKKYSIPEDYFSWCDSYDLIECLGCENIQFREIYTDDSMIYTSEEGYDENYYDIKYFPNHLVNHQELDNFSFLPNNVKNIYLETLEAMKNNCKILAGVGLRAIIEATCNSLSISGKNLQQKIDELSNAKYITKKDSERLHSIRFLGNDSVHDMDVPSQDKLLIALEVVEHLIKDIYLLDIDMNRHLDTIITTYTDFKNVLMKCVKDEKFLVNDKKSIKEFLGKDSRRFTDANLLEHIPSLIKEIDSSSINFIKKGDFVKNTQYFIKM